MARTRTAKAKSRPTAPPAEMDLAPAAPFLAAEVSEPRLTAETRNAVGSRAKPLPDGVQFARRKPRTPQPVIRQSMTIVPPWDPYGTSPVTCELVIIGEATHLDSETATPEQVPELQEAGWISMTLGVLDIYFRAIM